MLHVGIEAGGSAQLCMVCPLSRTEPRSMVENREARTALDCDSCCVTCDAATNRTSNISRRGGASLVTSSRALRLCASSMPLP